MPLTRFKLSAIGNDGITSEKLAHNLDFDGTHIRVPHGTTAERPSSPEEGYFRYNTTESTVEQWNGTAWVTLASPPVVTSVTPSDTNGDSGTVITVNGSNFTASASVRFITQGGTGTEYTAGTTTFVNSTQVTGTFPQDFDLADEPLDVKVVDSVGSSTLEDAITLGGSPTWTTAAGSLGSGYEGDAFSATIVATDPEGGDVDYALSSGALPSGITLNTETGVISGTFTSVVRSNAVSSAVITPSDSVGNDGSTRTFTITQNGDGDDNYEYMMMRLTGDGSDGDSTTSFSADSVASLSPNSSSSNPYAGGFNPYHPDGYWSIAMDGNYDGLEFLNGTISGIGIGTGNFTYEFWMKETGSHYASQARYMIQGVSGTTRIEIATDANNNNLRLNLAGTDVINASWTPNENQWYHIAAVREGTGTNQTKLYVDGVLLASGTATQSIAADQLLIGALNWGANYGLNGFMSNFRVSSTARYTAAFTPSTSPFTSDNDTILLTCASNRFIDKKNSVRATYNGQATVVPVSPFLLQNKQDFTTQGSVYFDGTDDWLKWNENSAFQLGTGAFTVETWVWAGHDTPIRDYWASFMAMNGDGISQDAITFYIGKNTEVNAIAGAINADLGGSNTSNQRILGDYDVRGQWIHVAYTRDASNVCTLWLNGVSQGTITNSTSLDSGNGWGLKLGLSADNQANQFAGYLGEIRIVDGSALYTTTFTPPTSPLTNVSGTTFLKTWADDNGVKDHTGNTNWITRGSGCRIDTSSKKFGTGSIYLNTTDGSSTTSGCLETDEYKYRRLYDFSGDWTFDFWIKGPAGNKTADGQYRRVYDNGGNNVANSLQLLINVTGGSYGEGGCVFAYDDSNYISNGQTIITGSGQPDVCDNQWHHIRIVHDYSASTIYEYTDGTLYSTRTSPGNVQWRASAQSGGRPRWGANSTDVNSGRFVGQIDDIRIYNGLALSTGSSYTVPDRTQPIW